MSEHSNSRRAFLGTAGQALGGLWLATHWHAVAAAAHSADMAATSDAEPVFTWLKADEAPDVDALCACIVPGGDTSGANEPRPGAHEARVVVFIDRAMGSFFADRGSDFRQGLSAVRSRFAADHGKVFAQADTDQQIAFMQTIDSSPFFADLRFLTIFGLLSSQKYGGNYRGAGWKLLGFADEHIFSPPFGYYDRDYQGFKPYPAAHDQANAVHGSKS